MDLVTDEDAFFAAPSGRYLAAPFLVYWCARPSLWGVTFAGTLDLARVDRLIGWIEAEFRHEYAPYDTLLDFGSLSGLEEAAFARWAAWYQTTRERQSTRVRRAVLVRPSSGLMASLVAGLTHVLGPLIPWHVCATVAAGLRWLEVPDAGGPERDLEALRQAAEPPQSALEALRRALDGAHREATLEMVAARLGLSVRTLQRQLRAAGTRFEFELQSARVRHAQRMLADTDEKLGAIAAAVGFATQAHFNAVFRRHVGATPGAWRLHARVPR